MRNTITFCIILLLSLTSCSKSLSKGLYFADTQDGLLYLELMSKDKCVMFFQGKKHEDCSYHISNGEINLIGHASTEVGQHAISWWFGGSLGPGVIKDNTFKIQGMRTESSDFEYQYLTFYSH